MEMWNSINFDVDSSIKLFLLFYLFTERDRGSEVCLINCITFEIDLCGMYMQHLHNKYSIPNFALTNLSGHQNVCFFIARVIVMILGRTKLLNYY